MNAKLWAHIKKDPVLWISGVLAAGTAFLVPPDAGYAGYIDLRTLALLFSLMAVVGALARRGLLDAAAGLFIQKARSVRGLGLLLVLLCYTSAMLITNDVALLTFVPLALVLMREDGCAMMVTVILQTAAANLGSMLTPFGNPQNLYLYTAYGMTGGEFMKAVLPAGLMALPLLLALVRLLPRMGLAVRLHVSGPAFQPDAATLALAALFLLCVAAVLRLVPWPAAFLCTLAALLLLDRRALKNVDYALLLTFCFFFIFVKNLARLEAVKFLLNSLLAGRELLASALVSQFVSNVPAALMLSGFTDKGSALVTGTNVGGLGTLIASMASLISFKLYTRAEGARPMRYLIWFSAVNFGLLAVLLAFTLAVN